jgi:hypothetical protein
MSNLAAWARQKQIVVKKEKKMDRLLERLIL